MAQTQDRRLFDQIQELSPQQVQSWLDRVRQGHEEAPQATNWWLGLAEMAAGRARDDANLDWAQVATSIYDHLADTAGNDTDGSTFSISSMMLRASMITKLGDTPDHPILDRRCIVRWFFDSLEMTYEQAALFTINWQQLAIEEILKLRRIKNRLLVIKLLVDNGLLDPDADLEKWMGLRAQLP